MFASLGRVVWFSSKVTDGAPLADVCDLVATCSLIGEAGAIAPDLAGYCLERETGQRWDYDERSFDDLDISQQTAIAELVQHLASTGPITLLPFFAYRLTSTIALSTPNVTLLGNPPDLERMFDQKPWVEHHLGRLGVPTVRWRHFRKSQPPTDCDFPVVVRPPSGTGGQGMYLVADPEAMAALLADPAVPEFLSAASYLTGAVSVNVTGCVNADGSVSGHPVSVQVIGSPMCTTRTFGYCGNDFGLAARLLEPVQIEAIEQHLRTAGKWMHGYGFRGAFGLDLMLVGPKVVVSELNPRFQGSSHLGAELMRGAGFDDVYSGHVRAHLRGHVDDTGPALATVVASQQDLAQVFCYAGAPAATDDAWLDGGRSTADDVVEFLPRPGIQLDPHALLFRYVTRAPVLDIDGRNLTYPITQRLAQIRRSAMPVTAGSR